MHPLIYVPRRQIEVIPSLRGLRRAHPATMCGCGVGAGFGGGSPWTPARVLGSLGAWFDFRSDSRGTYAAQPDIANAQYTSGVSGWNVVSGATLSVLSAVTPDGYNALRVANTGSNGAAWQARGTAGNTYYLRQWVRGDGVTVPRLYFGGGLVTGTASTGWQLLESTVVCGNTTAPYLMAAGTGYSDFGPLTATNISLASFDPRAATGALAGSALVQATPTAMPWYDDGVYFGSGGGMTLNTARADQRFLHNGSGCTLAYVIEPNSMGVRAIAGNSKGSLDPGFQLFYLADGSIVYEIDDGLGGRPFQATSAAGVITTAKTIVLTTFSTSGMHIRVNGVEVASDITITGSCPAGDANYDTTLGNVPTLSYALYGTVHETVITAQVLSASNIGRLERSLAAQHGIALP